MKVHVGSLNPVKIKAVEHVFRRVFSDEEIVVEGMDVDSGVSEQPIDDETSTGAINRAERAIQNAEFGVGIEAGLIHMIKDFPPFDVQFCAVVDSSGHLTLGQGPGFVYPTVILEAVDRGNTVGQAMGQLSGNMQIGFEGGAIGFLSRELMCRTELTEQAVLMALIPRIRKELYR